LDRMRRVVILQMLLRSVKAISYILSGPPAAATTACTQLSAVRHVVDKAARTTGFERAKRFKNSCSRRRAAQGAFWCVAPRDLSSIALICTTMIDSRDILTSRWREIPFGLLPPSLPSPTTSCRVLHTGVLTYVTYSYILGAVECICAYK
jgi:hypothetical protein